MDYLLMDTNIYVSFYLNRDKDSVPKFADELRELIDKRRLRLVILDPIYFEFPRAVQKQIDSNTQVLNEFKRALKNLKNSMGPPINNDIKKIVGAVNSITKKLPNISEQDSRAWFETWRRRAISVPLSDQLVINVMRRLILRHPPFDSAYNAYTDGAIMEVALKPTQYISGFKPGDTIWLVSKDNHLVADDRQTRNDFVNIVSKSGFILRMDKNPAVVIKELGARITDEDAAQYEKQTAIATSTMQDLATALAILGIEASKAINKLLETTSPLERFLTKVALGIPITEDPKSETASTKDE